ncbi:hypothetical protein COO91_01410 [Nostoc flagelliforme CCNUN1]|uniref:Uncharacterized protein n=1 Tax=Nostoc flagelliforme CCNUN1 TaxID=2038116 RepID=A0A2K8SJK7_9NOSO|nr:DUF5372 family protein [Nostoc flagelliforme]AUB35530.1 hypothetical protein COO91_01410 [Nostoc flagelliforme CCNUN1]
MHILLGIAKFYPRWLEQYSKTAHNFKSLLGSRVTIINPIHPLCGQSVVIQQIRKVGQETKVTVESPLGGFLSLPATSTDLWTQQAFTVQTVGKFLPEKLLRLSEWVAGRSQIITSESSCVLDDIEVEHKKKNEKKASTSNRSSQKRRKAKSPYKANSTVSGQNTLHSTDRESDN